MSTKINKAKITFIVWISLVGLYVFLNLNPNPPAPIQIKGLDQFYLDIKDEKVQKIIINYQTNSVYTYLKDNSSYNAYGYLTEDDIENVYEHGVTVQYLESTKLEKLNAWFSINFSKYSALFMPLLIFIGFFYYFLKKGKAQQTSFMSLKNSSAKLFTNGTNVTFNDIGGLDEIKEGVKDVISFLKDPTPWLEGGGKLPRGIILEGPPGTGKTLFARALATECKASFYSISGSEFVELFVGVGAARVRDLFEKAKSTTPAVIFIDEIDAIGRKRSVGHGLGSEEWDNTLNQLLSCMDGFERLDRVLVLAATNRLDILDPALMRAGRFDRSFSMKILSQESQEAILYVHLRGKKLKPGFSVQDLSSKISGLTGAELEMIVNEAALAAVSRYVKAKQNNTSAAIELSEEDILTAHNNLLSRKGRLASFDDAILESDSRLVTFRTEQSITVELLDHRIINGTVMWASPTLIKLKTDNQETLIRKAQIVSLK